MILRRILAGAVAFLAIAFGQAPSGEVFSQPPKEVSPAWKVTEWVDPDPYAKIWTQHRALKETPDEVHAELQRRLKDLPGDAQNAYELGYYAYVDSHVNASSKRYPTPQMVAAHMMARYPANTSAEFTRLRFLLQSRSWPGNDYSSAGRRLIARFAGQPGLRMHLAIQLVFMKERGRQDEGIQMLESLVGQYPADSEYLGTLADAYAMVGIAQKDALLKSKAKAAYERFLANKSLSDMSRRLATMRLQAVKRSMNP